MPWTEAVKLRSEDARDGTGKELEPEHCHEAQLEAWLRRSERVEPANRECR
jgi:hypothetical protein